MKKDPYNEIEIYHGFNAYGTTGMLVWDSETRVPKKIIGTLKYRTSEDISSAWLVAINHPYKRNDLF